MSAGRNRPGWFYRLLAVALLASSWLVMRSPGIRWSELVSASGTYDWLQFNGEPQHSGDNLQETILTSGNVANLGQVFHVTLPAVADGAPAYLRNVSTSSGIRDLLFLTTEAGDLVALDAHTGSQIWIRHNPAGSCRINNGGSICYTTSSPAIDPSREFVYGYGLDGKAHKYAVGSGNEVLTGGWPEVTTLKGFDEKGSPALSIATTSGGATYLYVANGGYPGDNGDYQGHVTTINLATGAQVVFNTLCANQSVHFVETPGSPDCPDVQSAVWARPGVVYDSAVNRIYFATGNGQFAPSSFAWGDSVLEVNPDGTSSAGGPLDSYTPANFQSLDNGDLVLGSTAPAILTVPASSHVPHLAVQGGKDAVLRLLNLDDLSGLGGPGHTAGEVSTLPVPQGGEVLTQPATWVNPADGASWVFVANGNGIAGLKLVVDGGGAPLLQVAWHQGPGGSSPIVADGVLYYATGGSIRALNPTAGGVALWQGTIGGVHWESPIVANGMLYSTDENAQLTAFGLPAIPTATPMPTSPPTPIACPTATPTGVATNTPAPTNTPKPTSTASPIRIFLPDLAVCGPANPPVAR